MKRRFATLYLILSMAGPVMADRATIEQYIDDPQIVGEAKFEYIFWDVYTAKLYASAGDYVSDKPFALSLTYLRNFDGDDIAKRSVKEMKSQGFNDEEQLDQWLTTMNELFPDVKKGETITGIADAQGVAHFYLDQNKLGEVDDPAFTQWFFAIWLSDKTSEPGLRKKLLNL
ncbi:chalcone isomerase family protein [Alteromonas sp. ASW11-36]|uniref:Chalcone isomerase family protein n=1 Tax=Alteromonas arenosi TaxID=3055817 RepID=A0ABT7STG0_9ALTE|nr:chalcone isomerase family protein [Alteromonas sp. ASW11-36]MDM7859479.1 chalcone isomerase family protein [Alteromonas sp. ASW11-36]